MRVDASVLEADSFGDKVLRLADATMLKLFRRKRWFSSAAWYPYAQRFADNALALHELGIPVPEVIDVYRIPSIERDAVHYRPLAGKTLREIRLERLEPEKEEGLKQAFTCFVIRLHESGVYFRSLHLGNVIYTPDHQFGLIDIADAKIIGRALSKHQRLRNLRRLQGMTGDSEWIDSAAVLNHASGSVFRN